MNKTEMIEHMARQADISKAAATRALEAFIGGTKTTLKRGGSITLIGFGSFTTRKRAARIGRDPRTGATLKIRARRVVKFKPGAHLSNAVN